MRLKIASVQFNINPFLPDVNLKKTEKFIKEAKNKKAKIVVFPEMLITPILNQKKFIVFQKGCKNYFQKLAKKYNIAIVPGSFIEAEKDSLYNTTYFIDEQGKIRGKYQKIHLAPLYERKYLKAGKKISIFKTKFGKAGLAICWDLSFPEIFRQFFLNDVKIVFCPSYWPFMKTHSSATFESEIQRVNALCQTRSFENNLFLVYVNAVGKTQEGKRLIGQTQVACPLPEKTKKLDDKNEGILFVDIDFKDLIKAERIYKIKKNYARITRS